MLSENFLPSTAALYPNCKSTSIIRRKSKDEAFPAHFEHENIEYAKLISSAATIPSVAISQITTIATSTATATTTIPPTKARAAPATITTNPISKQLKTSATTTNTTTTTTTTTLASVTETTTSDLVPTAITPTTLSTPTAPQCSHATATTTQTTIKATMTATNIANNNSSNNTGISSTTISGGTAISITAPKTINKINLNCRQKGKSSKDATGRSAALERAYVHDVYEHCEEPTGPIRPRVAQFLGNLDPGSVVCDVGCGSGRYLTQCNPQIVTIGVDRCYRLSKVAREKGGEVALCDNLELPFRDDSFDAVLSLAVVHHFATTERRVNALRELARILRIGGRVVITVWALEQRHRRFESQDVLIPWQPPKTKNFNCSDEEDDEDFLPPYHAYTEDSTNSSRSAGDGDSSSLSSSSPGESCYSFVRRAIQKLAGGRKHAWFLDSWTSKDTKNDSSLDYEDAKDLPIELRRLEDFEDFIDPPLSAGLKSRSLGSILNPPPRQIVRSRSSVPSFGGPLLHPEKSPQNAQQLLNTFDAYGGNVVANGHSPTHFLNSNAPTCSASGTSSLGRRPKLIKQKQSLCDEDFQLPENPFHMLSSYNNSSNSFSSNLYIKSSGYHPSSERQHSQQQSHHGPHTPRQTAQASMFLRKQSSLNEELMAANRIRENDRVRKRIQKQMSLNEAFLCRSAMFSKRLQIIREGFATRIKSSTGSLERATKNGITKIMQNIKSTHLISPGVSTAHGHGKTSAQGSNQSHAHVVPQNRCQPHQHYHHHHHHHYQHQQQAASTSSIGLAIQTHILYKQDSVGTNSGKYAGPVTYCNGSDCAGTACYCSTYHHGCTNCNSNSNRSSVSSHEDNNPNDKVRRHSRESGSDSSKDSSLQSDTSIESEDSFASVIFIPKPEQHQQQLNYQQQHQNSNSSSSNSSSSNGGNPLNCPECSNCCGPATLSKVQRSNSCTQHTNNGNQQNQQHQLQQRHHQYQHRIPSLPTSPLIMPCPPTPAHSPAAAQALVTSPPQTMAAVTAAMAILTPPTKPSDAPEQGEIGTGLSEAANEISTAILPKSRFTFDEAHIKEQQENQQKAEDNAPTESSKPTAKIPAGPKVSTVLKIPTHTHKITRQTIKDLPPIPKFRKQQSLQTQRQSFPIVRRSSANSGTAVPSIPKLLSLELFNPATDDLDSDSSEPSSPDSIDSVISAQRSTVITASTSEDHVDNKDSIDEPNGDDEEGNQETKPNLKIKQQPNPNSELKINPATPNDIILNDDRANLLPNPLSKQKLLKDQVNAKHQECAEFADQLCAQLQREIEDKNNPIECRSLEGLGDISEYLDDLAGVVGGGGGGGSAGSGSGSLSKKRNGDIRDITALREELRERRLMLANLSTQPSLQQSPASSSTSSISSQTRSFTIHEEDEEEDEEENERSYTLQLYENCKISKFNYKRNRQYNLNAETAYLLQDDGDSSIRDDDDDDDIIIEEDEDENENENEDEEAAAAEDLEANSGDKFCDTSQDNPERKHTGNPIRIHSTVSIQDTRGADNDQKTINHSQQTMPNRQTNDPWEHSNSSTTSLESPSQGGATTHHRYYHVFREGELDALINHNVTSLHIVSSYYERASWCVVAEKVQVWTI